MRHADSVSTAAVVWFVLALALAGAELVTLTFALGMGAVACAAGGAAALLGAEVAGQGAAFVAVLAVLLVGVRPVVRRHLQTSTSSTPSGIAALIGTQARVTLPIGADGGQVRLGGELWSARLAYPIGATSLPAGSAVVITAVDAASVVVSPLEIL